jgi:hypothetical protein
LEVLIYIVVKQLLMNFSAVNLLSSINVSNNTISVPLIANSTLSVTGNSTIGTSSSNTSTFNAVPTFR